MNKYIGVGRLTRDPNLKYIPTTGNPVAGFAIAINSGAKTKDGKEIVDFVEVRCWNKSAENCANFLEKGSLVAIEGALKTEAYETEGGEKRRFTYVNASRVQFLSTKKKENSNEPSFEPCGLDPQGFQAIDDDDIPF